MQTFCSLSLHHSLSRLQGKHSQAVTVLQSRVVPAGLELDPAGQLDQSKSQFKLRSHDFSKKREGLFSTLTIQWLDIPSLHSETIQWGVLVLPCAIYRIQETVVKLLEMLEHGITCHELHHCPFLHLGWQRRGVLNKKKRVNSVTFLRLGKEAEGAELSKHLPWRTANNVFV